MDIYILHHGEESGPFSENAARDLLEQGGVAGTDFAWRSGMADWLPLSDVLAAARLKPATVDTPAPPSDGRYEAATPKQKALLSYLGISLPAELSRDQAARLVNDALEDPGNTERLSLWNEERLRLHPELFAAEIQAKKENRARHFFELCQGTGAAYFGGVTKAHCQVLVAFLDVKFPHWDAREAEAAQNYFFPAVAEKFPQLVNKAWRGRLRYADGMKIAPEMVHRSPTSPLRETATSPLAAVVRGVFAGIFILAVLYLAYRTMHHEAAPVTGSSDAAAEPGATTVGAQGSSAVAAVEAVPPLIPAMPTPAQKTPPADGVPPPPMAQTETMPPPAPTMSVVSVPPPQAAPAPLPAAPMTVLPDPGMSPAPMVADPGLPMTGGAIPPPPPGATLPGDPLGMAMNSTGVATAPMATLPGSEPPVPVPPPAATLPAAGMLPSAPPAAPPEAAPVPIPTVVEPPVPGASAKTSLVLTKAVEVQLTYGKIMLPVGTPVKLVTRQGSSLRVIYRTSVITVPVTSTDLE